jgi:creatinine amidohydrolase/Fe(II)-dependent formamide hydrolase-like protein
MEVDRMSAPYLLDLFPSEVEAEFAKGNDLALLPILSIEQHGPHLVLGTDGYGALAIAQELGKITGGLVLPPVPFCWEGCTNAFAGGVGVREGVFVQYLRSVVKGLWRSGFRRIVILNTHGGNFYAMHDFPNEVLKEDGVPVLTVYGLGPSREANELLDRAGGEAAAAAGALRLLGREDLVEKLLDTNRKAVAEFGDKLRVQLEPPSARAARRLGNVGHDYSHECLHVQPEAHLDPEMGAASLRKAAEEIAPLLEDYRAYVQRLLAAGEVVAP